MKKLLFIILTIFLILQSCKSQKNLYLYFNNNSKYMNKVRMGENNPYNYSFDFNKNIDINLTSNLSYFDKKPQIDTLSLKILKRIKLRDYKWLNKFVNKFKNPDLIYFSNFYKNTYVVEIDSINKKVIISKVKRIFYED